MVAFAITIAGGKLLRMAFTDHTTTLPWSVFLALIMAKVDAGGISETVMLDCFFISMLVLKVGDWESHTTPGMGMGRNLVARIQRRGWGWFGELETLTPAYNAVDGAGLENWNVLTPATPLCWIGRVQLKEALLKFSFMLVYLVPWNVFWGSTLHVALHPFVIPRTVQHGPSAPWAKRTIPSPPEISPLFRSFPLLAPCPSSARVRLIVPCPSPVLFPLLAPCPSPAHVPLARSP